MVLRLCARHPKQPMVLGGPGFKTMYEGDVVMFLPNKAIKSKNLIIRKKNMWVKKKTQN